MFRTELPLTPHPQQLPLSARVLTIGSCFSDSIGSRLRDFKVTTMVNPFGTVFNPISVCRLLRAAAGEDMDWQQHVVEARGRWQSHDLHAEIGAETPVELLQHIQTLTREVGVFLATADVVVLTLGSAFAYRLRETDAIISNCHKLPAEKFEKELLTADDIIAAVAETHAYLRRINPRLRFILTVSPVRHIKDTLVLNSTSKSMLRVACHYLSELLPDVTYFPAYELLLDDLRDYRFYAADMLHPSEVAENYIWERFTRTYFDAGFGRFKKEWEGIRQAMGHKPTYAAAPEHRQFLESTLERLRRLGPQADVRMETLHLERELADLPLPYSAPEPEPEEEDDEERIDIGEYAEKTPTSQASLLGAGAGILREDPIDDDNEEEEQDEPASTPDSAYEHAYAAGLADEEQDEEDAEEADAAVVEGEEPARRKKRRSRGGAKRTKRKHARLAAEAAGSVASEQVTSSLEPLTAVGTGQVQQTARGEQTDAEQIPALAETPEPEQNEPARRSRNNRRNQRERPERSGSRTARPALYAEEPTATEVAGTPEPIAPASAEENQPTTQPVSTEQAPQPSDTELAVTEPLAVPEAEEQAPRPKRAPASRSRKKPVDKTEPVSETVPSSEEVAAVEQANPAPAELPVVASEATEVAASVVAAAPPARARRKPAAKVAAPVAPVAVEPVTEPSIDIPAATAAETPAAKPARKRPARKPKPAEAPEVSIAAAEPVETAPELPAGTPTAPKRKPRPPRKKPATDASATENS
ncbi:GSCFA domain-containing protein [Hymenobacter endophyticus]|uniref:GSCFA domain-containing protein n=1 Tax=Hymenobacter endophyticus TaxID=3076335 RepID=A0ABU3TIA6_9BACT|nr:GSCFA domain-containing protein [Hymenobacter endophyticus]MDU0371109.1 GSCFA domain-containing protein [Hymenobacter endophyticus]